MRRGSATPTLRRAGGWPGGLGRRAGPSRDAGLGLLYSALTGRPVSQVQVVNRRSLASLQTKRSQAHFVTGSGRNDAGGDQQVSAAQVLQASCRGRHSRVLRRERRALSPLPRAFLFPARSPPAVPSRFSQSPLRSPTKLKRAMVGRCQQDRLVSADFLEEVQLPLPSLEGVLQVTKRTLAENSLSLRGRTHLPHLKTLAAGQASYIRICRMNA